MGATRASFVTLPISRGFKFAAPVAVALALVACVSPPPTTPSPASSETGADAWHAVTLPGKRVTRYAATHKAGRWAVAAQADRSASMWRRRVDIPHDQLGRVKLSWWVDQLNPAASVTDIDTEDAVARVVFAFEGDRGQLSPRTRAMFDLAQLLTGEAPPYATLMYVWDTHAEPGSVIVNPRSDRIRKIVLDSGNQQLGQWRDHQRDLAADFQRAFGEAPGKLVGIAFMTDADNTGTTSKAWYGRVDVGPNAAPR